MEWGIALSRPAKKFLTHGKFPYVCVWVLLWNLSYKHVILKNMRANEIKEVNKLIERFPRKISVAVEKYRDGFVAVIKNFPGCATQGSSFSELIEMVNDAVRSYFEIPEKYIPFMPDYKPPLALATKLDLFPTKRFKKSEIKLEIQDGAEVTC